MPAPVASGGSESPGGPCTHWKSAALSRRTWITDVRQFRGERVGLAGESKLRTARAIPSAKSGYFATLGCRQALSGNRWFADSPLEGCGFELPVPRCALIANSAALAAPPPEYQGFRAASELGRSILAAGQPSNCRPTTDRGCKAAPFKEPPLTAESGALCCSRAVRLGSAFPQGPRRGHRAHRGVCAR
jgi:hypothetical protein